GEDLGIDLAPGMIYLFYSGFNLKSGTDLIKLVSTSEAPLQEGDITLEKPEIVDIHLYVMAILTEMMESSMVGMCSDQTLRQAEGKSELMNYCVGEFPIPCNVLIWQLISTRFVPQLVLSTSKCCKTSEIPCCS
uniref:Uncharacterized protein n=1 Tax=Apteryx owenii TaxID=8824 RepID=A0A8B9SC85_APTOW